MQHRCIRSIKRTGTFGTFLHTSTTLDTSRRVTEHTVINNRNSRYGAYIDTIFALRTQVLIRHWSLRRGRTFSPCRKNYLSSPTASDRKFVHLFELLLDGTSEPDGSFMIGSSGRPAAMGISLRLKECSPTKAPAETGTNQHRLTCRTIPSTHPRNHGYRKPRPERPEPDEHGKPGALHRRFGYTPTIDGSGHDSQFIVMDLKFSAGAS